MRATTLSDTAREIERIKQLECVNILDTDPSAEFDQITRLASDIFQAPIALVTLMHTERQWFKSKVGMLAAQIDRHLSFCNRVLHAGDVVVIEDISRDAEFASSPFVVGPPRVRFYAGAPLTLSNGHTLGTLCVMDHEPRAFSDAEKGRLRTLANLAMAQIDLYRRAGRINELTRLPNRAQMGEDIDARNLIEPSGSRGMLLLDVMDHHKLQDAVRAIGIERVDAMLIDIAINVQRVAGSGWPVYHVSETRFCLKMRGETRAEREAFCQDMIAQLEEPFESQGLAIQIEIHAGLTDFTLAERGGADAFRKATAALLEAGARGHKFQWHDQALDLAHARAYSLIKSVSGGLARGEFRLVYQPKYNVKDRRFSGVESLARWTHPTFGNVSPGEFIPFIEKTALTQEFTQWALGEALSQIARWRTSGLDLTIAVNVSSLNLDQPGFAQSVRDACHGHGVDPKWLHVECTESAVLSSDETRVALEQIRALGSQISLDDFGMAYSNLACLRDLPVQMLKLDQSLIKPIDTDPAARHLAISLISLGQALGFRMLAEGVETQEACAMLLAAGCDAMQGYYLARPMEASAIPAFMASPPVDPALIQSSMVACADRTDVLA